MFPSVVTVFGAVYDISGAPDFVRFGINLWADKYGTDLTVSPPDGLRRTDFDANSPDAVRHYVHDLGTRFGVAS